MERAKYKRLSNGEMTADLLNGAAVYGPAGEKIGSVSHVHGSGPSGLVIVDVGGFLGIGAKPVPVSLDQLEFRRDEYGDVHAVTASTKDQLGQAPKSTNRSIK